MRIYIVMCHENDQCIHIDIWNKLCVVLCAFTGNMMTCKFRVFHICIFFVCTVHGGFHLKIKCVLKVQSKSENPQRSAAVRKFHAYESSEVPHIRNFSVCVKYSGFTVNRSC